MVHADSTDQISVSITAMLEKTSFPDYINCALKLKIVYIYSIYRYLLSLIFSEATSIFFGNRMDLIEVFGYR